MAAALNLPSSLDRLDAGRATFLVAEAQKTETTIEFTVAGVPCLGLDGGPAFKHSEAFSFQIATDDQQETDRYWNSIVGNGGRRARAAGAKISGACPGRLRRVC